jgi:hypothetical protein
VLDSCTPTRYDDDKTIEDAMAEGGLRVEVEEGGEISNMQPNRKIAGLLELD